MILIGTKADLRNDAATISRLSEEGKSPLNYTDGLKAKRKIGAVKYIECSAKTLQGVQDVFEEAIRVGMNPEATLVPTKKRKKFCTVL